MTSGIRMTYLANEQRYTVEYPVEIVLCSGLRFDREAGDCAADPDPSSRF